MQNPETSFEFCIIKIYLVCWFPHYLEDSIFCYRVGKTLNLDKRIALLLELLAEWHYWCIPRCIPWVIPKPNFFQRKMSPNIRNSFFFESLIPKMSPAWARRIMQRKRAMSQRLGVKWELTRALTLTCHAGSGIGGLALAGGDQSRPARMCVTSSWSR